MNDSFGLVSHCSGFALACALALSLRPRESKAEALLMLTEPPMPSPSMSGVMDLLTSRADNSSDGMTSSATERLSFSGAGTLTPLMVVTMRFGSMPRMPTNRPSPWSRSRNTPETRCSASETLRSGNWPMSVADTTETMPSAARCWFSAAAVLAVCLP